MDKKTRLKIVSSLEDCIVLLNINLRIDDQARIKEGCRVAAETLAHLRTVIKGGYNLT